MSLTFVMQLEEGRGGQRLGALAELRPDLAVGGRRLGLRWRLGAAA